MTQRAPVEVTKRYATSVDTLGEAWAFVMDHVDRVGSAPSIEISPVWSSEDDFATHHFSAVVSGMVQVPLEAGEAQP